MRKITVVLLSVVSAVIFSACTNPFAKQPPAGLQVTTEGSEASVFLNGEYVNKTPYIDKELKPGEYVVRVEPDDKQLASHETTVQLTSGTLSVFSWTFGPTVETSGGAIYEMEPLSNSKKSAVAISSIPDGSIVKLDSQSQGFTPTLIQEISPGSHKLQVSLPSYVEQQRVLNIIEGYQMNVTIKLAKELASLDRVASPSSLQAPEGEDASSSAEEAEPTATPATSRGRSLEASSSATTSLASGKVEITETGTGWLRVRSEPGLSGEEVAKVDVGKIFSYYDTDDGWYQIEYETGEKGWVSGQYVEVTE